ncbi:MAG: helix-turn-helix domain-containing protein [Acidimicrobiales bacterium]
MVVREHHADEVSLLFQALADPTRRDLLRRTLQSGDSVSRLTEAYSMSFAAVQKHVAVLERAGLVTKERRGREQIVRGNVETIRRANAVLADFEALWRGRIDRIDALLLEEKPKKEREER